MASQNDTIIDTSQLTHDDLLEAYDKLASSYRNAKNELDETSQKLHSQNQQRKVFESLERDLQSELDQIHSVHSRNLEQSEKKIESLKQSNQQLMMEKQGLESKIDDFGLTIKELKLEVEGLKGLLSEKSIKPRISDTYSKSLEIENEDLRNRNNDLEIQLQTLNQKLLECATENEEFRDKIKCMDENVETKKTQLEEKNEVIEHMQDKIHELTTELVTLRNTAVVDDSRKGNSLFAEVDSQRQEMKKILKGERQHYLEMRKAYNAKEMEIRRLRRENLNIKSEIQSCSSLINRGDSLVSQNLSHHCAQLEGINKSLESQLKEMNMRLVDMASNQKLHWIETLMTSAAKENREMKDKILVLMREKNSVIDNCAKTMKDLAKVKLDVVKFKTLLGRIVDEFKLRIKPEKYLDIGVNEEFLKNLEQDDMEIDSQEQSVTESVDITDVTMSENLNESTIILLGGRERLGSALPETLRTSSELSFKNIASSSSSDISSDVNAESSSGSVTNATKSHSIETSKESVTKENSSTTHVNPNASTPSSTSTPTKPVLQEKVPIVNEIKNTTEEPRVARKRGPLIVKKIVIPSKVPRKQQNPQI